MAAKPTMVKQQASVFAIRDKPSGGVTTLNAAAAAGATSISAVSNPSTAFASGKIIRIGEGEEMEIQRISGAVTGAGPFTFPTADGLIYPHVAGEAVVEEEVYDMGDVMDGGVSINLSGESTDVTVATRRLVYQTLNGYVNANIEFDLPGFSLYNYVFASGMLLSRVHGAGTNASPFSVTTDGSEFGEVGNQSFVSISTLFNGTNLREELWGCDTLPNLSFQLNRGVPVPVKVRAVSAAGGIATSVAHSYTPITTFRAGKGKMWDKVDEIGFFEDVGTPTTLNGAVAAGVNSIIVTNASAAGIVADSWIRLNPVGEFAEYHWVQAVSTNTLTLRTYTYRAQANGISVTRQVQTKFGGVSRDGFSINVTGNAEPLGVVTSRFDVGVRAGTVQLSANINITDISLSNLARVCGIPQSQIVANRLPITSANFGSVSIDGVYCRGTLKDGSNAWVVLAGCSQDLSAVAKTVAATGQTTVPLTVKPASNVLMFQY